MIAKTNALRLLDASGIPYEAVTYSYSDEAFSAEAVAEEVGVDEVFKTLVVLAPEPVFAVVPAGAELDLKALAGVVGSRRASMAPLAEVESLTGYQRGAVTVLGAKRAFPVLVDEMAATSDRIAVSAGARGIQVVLSTEDYLTATDATLADIAR